MCTISYRVSSGGSAVGTTYFLANKQELLQF